MEIIGWKDMTLIFKGEDFEKTKSKIEKWYGVKVKLDVKLSSDWVYSGIYRDESLENVLRGICLTSGLEYKIKDNNVTLFKPL